ncbi:diacylglycerol kinase family protein [Halalkalibacter sp. APA_J-10(15)]|uniref:diacylglycerol/lipid kinase family protein n=1 Tax=unclassified Halalkalibacter TaxID=2893063 RepID=UPI001FF427D4|nr:diacylglycerol kinase family protein [Halalkalibacter sp. APA_J-10(15)]MCK0472201.1 diacylglycerol kinase family lipid kinase [Halalkalibacter sp. APA_J-10(15)]
MYGFIVNQASGNGRGNRVWKKVERVLTEENKPFVVRFTKGPRHATEIAKELLAHSLQAVVVIGGDGTINEVATALAYTQIPLGVIPAGSGNDFARCLGIPLQYRKALLRVFSHDQKKVDLLHLGQRYCLTVTGVGFDGKVAQTANEAKYKSWLNHFGLGGFSYVVSMLEVLRTYQPTKISLTVNGEKFALSDVWLVAVANAPNYAGGISICPQAVNNDGLLNICIVHGLSKWGLIRLFVRAYNGTHVLHRNVQVLTGKEVFIHSDKPVLVQSDGEIISESPIRMEIKEGALNIV